jgi:6-phosphogluconolactonase
MSPEIFIGEPAVLAERIAADFAAEAGRAVAERGRVGLALSGGSAGTTFFGRLATVPFDWDRSEFFWADERAVPPSDADSNYAMANALWLEPAGVPKARVHRMLADAADPDAAVIAYAAALAQAAGTPPRLDYVILGAGPDGHVASLFPGHPLLHEERRTVAFVTDSPKPPPRRMTLTLPVLANARRMIVAAFGASKAAIVREALEDSASNLPLAIVARRAVRPLFLLDEGAASLLSR